MYLVPCGNPSEQCKRWTVGSRVWGQLEIPQAACKISTTGQDSEQKDIFFARFLIQLPLCQLLGKASGIPTAVLITGGANRKQCQQCIYVVVKEVLHSNFHGT